MKGIIIRELKRARVSSCWLMYRVRGEEGGIRGEMESLIDDEGAKRKVRGLIGNIGNYSTRGDRGHLPSL